MNTTIKTDKRDGRIVKLRKEIDRLQAINLELTNKIMLLESISNIDTKSKMEEAEHIFYQKIKEVNELKLQYESLIEKQSKYTSLYKSKYKKQIKKAVEEFKQSLSHQQ